MEAKIFNRYSSPELLGIQNHLCVLTCGSLGEISSNLWSEQQLLPYTNYVLEGKPIDHMFNGFIFNGLKTRHHRDIHPLLVGFGSPSRRNDWSQWIKQLFAPNYNLSALNNTAPQSVDVWLSIPYPHPFQDNFGRLDQQRLNFKNDEHRVQAVKWFITTCLDYWEQAHFTKLKLRGFLWQRESIDKVDEDVLKQTNAYIKKLGLHSMWLTNYRAYGVIDWEAFGFSVVALNPNYYGNTSYDYKWIEHASYFAKAYGIGMQINYGKGVIYNETHLLDYLNLGILDKHNYMNESLLVYQIHHLKLGEVIHDKMIDYIRIYTFIKGIYQFVPYEQMPY